MVSLAWNSKDLSYNYMRCCFVRVRVYVCTLVYHSHTFTPCVYVYKDVSFIETYYPIFSYLNVILYYVKKEFNRNKTYLCLRKPVSLSFEM